MRKFMLIAWLAIASSQTLAAECQFGAIHVLTLDQWQIADDKKTVDVTYTNATSSDISITDGAAFFFDPLGNQIGSAALDPDVDIAAGASVTTTANAIGLQRVGRMSRSEIIAMICVRSVVYADGKTETFEADAGSLSDAVNKLMNPN